MPDFKAFLNRLFPKYVWHPIVVALVGLIFSFVVVAHAVYSGGLNLEDFPSYSDIFTDSLLAACDVSGFWLLFLFCFLLDYGLLTALVHFASMLLQAVISKFTSSEGGDPDE